MRWSSALGAVCSSSAAAVCRAVDEQPRRRTSGAPDRAAGRGAQAGRLTAHGIERIDDYAWLRDRRTGARSCRIPSRLAPEIRAYLDAENNYADAVLAPLAQLRAKLVAEMKGRIEPDDSGVPMPDGPYAYWRKFVPGAEHPQSMRRAARRRAGGGPRRRQCCSAGKGLFLVRRYRPQPGPSALCLYVDDTGSESFTLRVRDLAVEARSARCHHGGVADFTWARQQDPVLCAARRRAAGALRLPASPRDRSRRRSAGLRGKGPAVSRLGRPHAQRPLRRHLDRQAPTPARCG